MEARGDSCPYKCKVISKEVPRVGNWQDLPSSMSVALNMKKVSAHFGSKAASSGHLPLGSPNSLTWDVWAVLKEGVWCPLLGRAAVAAYKPNVSPPDSMASPLLASGWTLAPPLPFCHGCHSPTSFSASQPQTPPTPCGYSQCSLQLK